MLKFSLYVAGVVFATLILVNVLVFKKKSFTSKQYNQPDLTIPDLKSSAVPYSEDTLSFFFHYHKIVAHFQQPYYQETSTGFIYRPDEALTNYYTKNYCFHDDTLVREVGHYSLGLFYFFDNKPNLASEHISQLNDKNLPEIRNIKGVFYMKEGFFSQAENNFKQEIRNTNSSAAYENLTKVLKYQKDYNQLDLLLKNPSTRPYVMKHSSLMREIYFMQGYYVEYLRTALKIKTNIPGFLAALLIAMVWMLFLYKINLFKKTSIFLYILVFFLGTLTSFLAPILYDFFHFRLGFSLNGSIINDFLYCVFGIGLVEEFVKILPLLLVLRIPGFIKEPVDYLIWAGCSALGFAFMENLLYFKSDSQYIFDGRAFVAVISHLFDSCIIAYGLILSKYRYQKKYFLYFIAFYLLAALSHGFYDFWLLNESVRYFFLYTYAYMLLSMLILTSFINNALNQSPYFITTSFWDPSGLKKYLLAGLASISLFEYVATALLHGTAHANSNLYGSIFFVIFFIAFLSSNLTNFDLVKGHWGRINLADFKQKLRYQKVIGKTIIIQGTGSSILNNYLPVKGIISQREKFSEITDYFAINLEEPLKINGEVISMIIVRAKDERQLIWEDPKVIVYFLTPVNMDVIKKENKEKNDLKFWDWAVVSPE